jgi:hypothetical protein
MANPEISKALVAFEEASNHRMASTNEANAPRWPLFHYTNEQALVGIIKSEQFWFTSIYHMDDPEELTFGFNVSRALLQEAIGTTEGLTRAFCQDLLEAIAVKRPKELVAFYSISFGMRDDLQQWERYGDRQRGVSFGLDPRFFRPAPFANPNHPRPSEEIFCSKVSYGVANASARHSVVIGAAFALINQAKAAGWLRSSDDAVTLCQHLGASMYTEILWNCVTTKDSRWRHQNETRLLARNFLKKPHLRIVNANERPRLEIIQPQLRTSIIEVMIGPKADSLASTRVRKLLFSYGLPNVLITRASGP